MPKPKIHVVLSQKGGVGKTTIAMNLAATVADVLGGDPVRPPVFVGSLDPQASAVWWAERGNTDALPFDYDQFDDRPDELAKLVDEDYEHCFLDAPGSLARPAVLGRALEIADDVLVPVNPEPLAYPPTEATVVDLIQPRGLPYLVVRNNWDRRDGTLELDKLTRFLDNTGLRYANTVIRRYKMITTSSAAGRVVTQFPAGRTATESRADFLALALECGYGGSV